jgi:hypothetical protein
VVADNHGPGVSLAAGVIGRVAAAGEADGECVDPPPSTARRIAADNHGTGISIAAGSIGTVSTGGTGGEG